MRCLSVLDNAHSGLVYDVKSSPLVNGLFVSTSGEFMLIGWNQFGL